ncbi:hypothetical protein RI054_04g22910 [Pseudoscourfieldia marina]
MPSYVKALLVASAGLLAPSATHAAQVPCPNFSQFANKALGYTDCLEEMTKEVTQLAMLVKPVEEAKLEGKDLEEVIPKDLEERVCASPCPKHFKTFDTCKNIGQFADEMELFRELIVERCVSIDMGGGGDMGITMVPSEPTTIDWKQGMDEKAQSYTAKGGEVLKLEWSGSHNVYHMASKEAFDSCNFEGAKNLGDTSPVEVTITEKETYLSCEVGSHCQNGQKLAVMMEVPSGPTITTKTTATTTTTKAPAAATTTTAAKKDDGHDHDGHDHATTTKPVETVVSSPVETTKAATTTAPSKATPTSGAALASTVVGTVAAAVHVAMAF